MATKSIFKDVRIKNKELAKKFVCALENAEKVPQRDVLMSKKCSEASTESIKELFKDC